MADVISGLSPAHMDLDQSKAASRLDPTDLKASRFARESITSISSVTLPDSKDASLAVSAGAGAGLAKSEASSYITMGIPRLTAPPFPLELTAELHPTIRDVAKTAYELYVDGAERGKLCEPGPGRHRKVTFLKDGFIIQEPNTHRAEDRGANARGVRGVRFQVVDGKWTIQDVFLLKALDKSNNLAASQSQRQGYASRLARLDQPGRKVLATHLESIQYYPETSSRPPRTILVYEAMDSSLHAAQASLTPDQSREIIQDILAAVTIMHKEGCVHRDIKPENILVKVEDDTARAQLADFEFTSQTAIPSGFSGSSRYVSDKVLGLYGMRREDLTTFNPDLKVKAVRPSKSQDVFALAMTLEEVFGEKSAFYASLEPAEQAQFNEAINNAKSPPHWRMDSVEVLSQALAPLLDKTRKS